MKDLEFLDRFILVQNLYIFNNYTLYISFRTFIDSFQYSAIS